MTYKTDDYYRLDRNHTRVRSVLNSIDLARRFNCLKHVEQITIRGVQRDGTPIEITAAGQLLNVIIDQASAHCIGIAKTMAAEPLEEVDFDKAAKV